MEDEINPLQKLQHEIKIQSKKQTFMSNLEIIARGIEKSHKHIF